MHPSKLIGQKALRTKPHSTTGDRSYLETPITILAVTESHILFRYEGSFRYMLANPDDPRILGSDYIDDNWTSYDALMKLAEPKITARQRFKNWLVSMRTKFKSAAGRLVPKGNERSLKWRTKFKTKNKSKSGGIG